MSTVLVVDDEPVIRTLVRSTLEGAGYHVLEAVDGAGALRLARSERPALVLLDVALPRLSGLQVCRRLREDTATADTPVLLLTGLLRPGPEALEGAGAQGVVAKPFTPASLLAQVAAAVAQAAALESR